MYERDHILGKDSVAAVEWDDWSAWVLKTYGVAPGKDMKLAGVVSKSLLVASGSMDPVCNSSAIIKEMMVAYGR